jgi:predicted DNA-binding transcriptional regulator AlpA
VVKHATRILPLFRGDCSSAVEPEIGVPEHRLREVIAVDLEMKGLLTLKETARVLGLSLWKTYDLARRRKLPGLVRLGERRIYVRRAILESWLQGKDQEQKDESVVWP